MANPVQNNNGINAEVRVGNLLGVKINLGGTAKATDTQGAAALNSVTGNLAKNPNLARHGEDGGETDGNRQLRQTGNDGNGQQTQGNNRNNDQVKDGEPTTNRNDFRETGEDANLVNQPDRGKQGDLRASEQGLLNGNGHHKGEAPPAETPPIAIIPTDEKGNQNPGKTQTTPPIAIIPNQNGNGNGNGRGHQHMPPVYTNGNTNWQNNQTNNFPSLGVRFSVDLNLRANGNQPYGVIRQVVNQVLQQNDIYLSRSTLNNLVNHKTLQNSTQLNLPHEVTNLIQNVSSRVLSLLDGSQQNGKLIHQISKEIAKNIHENIQTAKHAIIKNGDLGAIQFKNLNIVERMHAAVDILPSHVPAKALESIQNHKAQEVLNALLLTRGLIVQNENPSEIRNLVALKSSVLPSQVSMASLRDVGQIVKVLIADAAGAKTNANLDLAVQKFVKILMANNELGVLLATVSLAAQAGTGNSGLTSRSIALAQIYDLINRLIQAGEKAMKEAAPDKNQLLKDRNIFQGIGLSEDTDDTKIQLNKLHAGETAGALKNFLEFNPAFVYDKSASVFNNPDDARQAQKDFAHQYHNDIAEWLESGNHRLVKDFDFDKPVGVVVERGKSDVFNATTARFVLVRDGSVQGWHFLKTFLVK